MKKKKISNNEKKIEGINNSCNDERNNDFDFKSKKKNFNKMIKITLKK